MPEVVCIKVSPRIDGWLREAYFGQLLDGHPRAIRVFDTFPLMRADGRVLYCLALEYARARRSRAPFSAARNARLVRSAARREIAGILEVLGKLHRGQMLHRDLTPMNVFVCDGRRLKLGDFGIVRQQSDRRGITARTMNALTAPSDILARRRAEVAGARRRVSGRAAAGHAGQGRRAARGSARPRSAALACSDHLKEIVYRCIGERRKRYESADEMIDALRQPPATLQRRRAAHRSRACTSRSPASSSRPRSDAIRAATASRRDRPRRAVRADHRRRPRPAEPAAGRRTRRRAQADGDQAAARERAADHAPQRSAVLASGREALSRMAVESAPRETRSAPAALPAVASA